jgi:hypothetical protein
MDEQPLNEMNEIDFEFSHCLHKWNYVESYNNPYTHIYNEITSKTKEEIEIELNNSHSELRQKILQYYSIIDHERKYNLTRAYIEIPTKLNIIMIEKLLFDRKFSLTLPKEWQPIFKEKGYEELYQLARKETLENVRKYSEKKLALLLQ